ncbi:hypothetical protein D3C75_1266070 [compost metagenome]
MACNKSRQNTGSEELKTGILPGDEYFFKKICKKGAKFRLLSKKLNKKIAVQQKNLEGKYHPSFGN